MENIPLKVLCLEDSPRDVEIMRELLVDARYDLNMDCTAVEKEFAALLRSRTYDIILADFKLPGFDAFGALHLSREICPNVPFICVSGSIGEETAVELLKQGAVDYVLKDRLGRLPSAIERALNEAKEKEARQRAEESLTSQNTLLTALINSPKDIIIFSLDKDYCYTTFNERHREEMKRVWNAEITIGMNLLECMQIPEIRALAKQSIDRALDGDVFSEIQHQPEHDIYYEFSWNPVLQDHKVIGATAFIRDTTERKRAAEALAESEKKYRALFETMSEGIVYEDNDGKIISANAAAEKLLGLSLDQMQGRTSLDPRWKAIHEDGSPFPGETHSLNVAAKTGKPATGEVMGIYNPKLDSHIWLSVNSNPEFLPGEKMPFRAYAVFRDITDRKIAEETLEKSEKQYRLLYDEMIIGFAVHEIICDQSGTPTDYRFLSVNKAFEKMTGLDAFDVLGKTVLEVLPGTEYSWIERYGKVALTGEPTHFENYAAALGKHYEVRAYCPEHGKFATLINDITERKRVEEALRENEQRLRRFYESGLIGVIYWNMNGQITDANDKFLEMVGYTREDLASGQIDWVAMTPPEYRYLDDRSVMELKATGVNRTPFEKEYIRKDGTRLPIVLAGAMQDEERFNGVAFILDITDQKKAEEALHESEMNLKRAQEIAQIGSWIFDLSGRMSWSDEMYRIYGVSPDTFTLHAESFINLIHPDDRSAMQEWIRACTAGEKPGELEFHTILPDGTVRNISGRGELICDAEERPTHMSGTAQDITERKLAEEALRESEEKFRETVVNLDEGFYSVTLDGVLLEHNQAFNRILGFEKTADLTGTHLPDFWQNPDERSAYLEEFAAKGFISNYQINAKTTKGEKINVLANAHIVKDRDNRPLRIEGVFLDITELKRAEEKILRQLEELRRWQEVTLGREDRVRQLKTEVNQLLSRLGETIRYPSQDSASDKQETAKG